MVKRRNFGVRSRLSVIGQSLASCLSKTKVSRFAAATRDNKHLKAKALSLDCPFDYAQGSPLRGSTIGMTSLKPRSLGSCLQ